MDHIFAAYEENINKLPWIGVDEKNKILNYTQEIRKFIGYHDNLTSEEGIKFYDNLREYSEDDFFNIVISLKAFEANRKTYPLKRPYDWSKYSQPHTVNAFYNERDKSIQFTAGIIQVDFM